MNIIQYQETIHWIYDKLEATIAAPVPSLRWVTEDPVVSTPGFHCSSPLPLKGGGLKLESAIYLDFNLQMAY